MDEDGAENFTFFEVCGLHELSIPLSEIYMHISSDYFIAIYPVYVPLFRLK
jgi:hypothetical protein